MHFHEPIFSVIIFDWDLNILTSYQFWAYLVLLLDSDSKYGLYS